jgi:hypothetical protein
VRLTPRAVEIFLKGERIAPLIWCQRQSSAHLRIRADAVAIGATPTGRSSASPRGRFDRPSHCRAVRADPEARPHPEQGFRACLGIVWLVRPFGADRLEAAATRAIEVGTRT